VRWLIGLVLVVLAAGTAAAQPVSYELQGMVPLGKKPAIRFTAAQAVAGLELQLERDDGKRFTIKSGALAKGQSVTLSVGDGAAGKAAYKGTLSVQVVGQGKWSDSLTFETAVRAPIKVSYDADHLDLDKRVLQFKVSRPVESAELVVIGEDGKELGKGSATFKNEPANKWLSITWTQPTGTRVMTMRLRVASNDGVASNVELVPWSVAIDHEDVSFATDSAVIEAGETAKLDASLVKITEVMRRSEKFVKMRLYIAGHTDTVGASAKNRKLSLDRALAIGAYLRKKGLSIPIAVAGFGEDVLKVSTADNTDERKNRRADYVVGPAAGAPPFKGPYLKAKAGWKQLK
jgi:outer membrane protein OmpA-like peptidoglycan-associated protein